MGEIRIKQASFFDREILKETMLKALESDPTAFTSSKEEYAVASEDWWGRYLGPYLTGVTTKMFFALEENNVVGMIGIFKNTRQRMRHVASVVWFWVDKNQRGKGIGRQLFNHLLEDTKRDSLIRKLNLTVTSNQTIAIEMYKKNGFEIVGTQKEEIQIDGVFYDFLTMEKFL